MDLIRWSMNRPVSVAVGVLLVVVFGLIGLTAIPVQLTPAVDREIVTVTTNWAGRSPQEVVDEITREQEKRLKNVRNLRTMKSVSREGQSEITLEFYLGADLTRALQEVSDALRQVPDYPEGVDQPVIKSAEGSPENAIAWGIIDLDPAFAAQHPDFDITTIYDALDDDMRPMLERIDGVAEVNIYGGREREVRVLLDPTALALRGLSHQQVIDAIRATNRNISAGAIAEGKRDYRVRVVGKYTDTQALLDTIVAYRDARPVRVRDVGTAEIGHVKASGFVRSLGTPCLAFNVIRQANANVVRVMEDVRERIPVIAEEVLPRVDPEVGKHLRIRQVYDETVYIDAAIDLVLSNLKVGGLLAILALLIFLRSLRSTLVISLAIPVSVIGTFLVMLMTGRTLNVISLAGLAFSTGMVVDNAIVVLENIDRRRKAGDPPLEAVYRGAREVWGAILAGTLTTVAVFAPILTVREEAGQIFFDLTLALCVSVLLSLTVALTVIPAGAAIVARLPGASRENARRPSRVLEAFKGLFGLAALGTMVTNAFAALLAWLAEGWRAWTLRPLLIVLLTGASLIVAVRLMPPLDYLPPGNRNLVFGGLLIPPGLSQGEQTRYAETIESRVVDYIRATRDPALLASLPPIPRFDKPGAVFEPVGVENFFIGAFQGGMFVGAVSADPQRVIPVGNLLTGAMNGMPDAFGGAAQSSIFGGLGGGNQIQVEISGPTLSRVVAAAGMTFGLAAGEYGYGNVQPNPSNFNLSQPEWQVRLSRTGRELGLRTEDLGVAVRSLVDGALAGEFQIGARTVDIKVLPTSGKLDAKEELASIPIAIANAQIVPLSSVATLTPSLAPQEVRRVEELPTVTIQITPPQGKPLQELMEEIDTRIIGPARQAGLIDSSMRVRMEGSAAKLDDVRHSLLGGKPSVGPKDWWQRLLDQAALGVAGAGLLGAAFVIARALKRRRFDFFPGAIGLLLLGLVIAGLLTGIATHPQLVMARFGWTLMVSYLLMAALFESFLYPLVIMFSVPFGLVGGFAALRIAHDITLRNPNIAPQQLDVLTMIGFVILVGIVVNNAILIVEQARIFMGHVPSLTPADGPLPSHRAIAQSVRTRVRPIFMTTFTTIAGSLPLVIAPGAGSEMYRGLGAVVIGGLLVSTLFTLVLVPLVFSLVMDLRDSAALALRPGATPTQAAA